MLGASQLKALLSPGRRPKTTNDADEEDNISLSDLIEPEPEVVASTTALPRTRRRGGKKDTTVQKMYYNLPQSKNRPSESTRSPRVRQTRNMIIVSGDAPGRSVILNRGEDVSMVQGGVIMGGALAAYAKAQEDELRKVESSLNECIISLAVSHATDKVDVENRIADVKTSLVYAENFQNNILLKKAIELDERTYTMEQKVSELEQVIRLSENVTVQEEMTRKFNEVGNYLEELRAAQEGVGNPAVRQERDELKALVASCASEIASLKERLAEAEATVTALVQEKTRVHQEASNRTDHSKPRPTSGRSGGSRTPVATAGGVEKEGSTWVDDASEAPHGGISTPGTTIGYKSVQNNVQGEGSSFSLSIVEDKLNTSSVIQSRIRDNETLLIRLNAVRGKIKNEVHAWSVKFEATNGRQPADGDKAEVLPLYKAYHEASLLYKQTVKELESLKQQNDDIKEQIKGSVVV